MSWLATVARQLACSWQRDKPGGRASAPLRKTRWSTYWRGLLIGALSTISLPAATAGPAAAASSGALTWAAQPPIPTARGCLASAVLDGNIYVVGGYTAGEVSALNTAEAYDPWTKHWRTVTPMPAAESCLAAASLDGRVYTIGGVDEAGDTVATVLFPTRRPPADGKPMHLCWTPPTAMPRSPTPATSMSWVGKTRPGT